MDAVPALVHIRGRKHQASPDVGEQRRFTRVVVLRCGGNDDTWASLASETRPCVADRIGQHLRVGSSLVGRSAHMSAHRTRRTGR